MTRSTGPVLSRRAFGGTTAAVLLAALAACGGEDETTEDAGAAGASSDVFPVSVTHKYGTTEITAKAARVVVVGLVEQDALLALGVVPVATTEWFGEHKGAIFPWATDELGSAAVPEVLSGADGVPFEKVAALRPDLILGIYSGLSQEDYATLSKIAPTVAQPEDSIDYGVAWQTLTTMVGTAVGQRTAADALVAKVEGTVATVAAANPAFKGKSAIMGTNYEGYYVFGPDDPRSRLLTELGFVLPTELKSITGEQFGANLSKERVDLLDQDVLVMNIALATDEATLKKEAGYANLTAVKEGRDLYVVDPTTFGQAASFITPLSLPYLVEGLVPMLNAALDGDPATRATAPA